MGIGITISNILLSIIDYIMFTIINTILRLHC